MLNHEPTGDQDCHFACVRETVGRGFAETWLTPQDRAYASGRRRPNATLSALAALRALLFSVTGRTGWIVLRAPGGKPSLQSEDGQGGPSVSLSHTPGLIAVAVARRGAIGVDVEQHLDRDFAALADHAFGPRERQEVAAGGLPAFYRIWTLREAIAKATGDGLAMVLNRTDLADPDSIAMPKSQCALFHAIPAPGYSLGMARLGGDGDLAQLQPLRNSLAL
jgi:phosphopantetheinyl transferase